MRILLTTTELSELLGMSRSRLAQWRCAGVGPPWLKVGAFVRYDGTDVDRWIDSQAKGGRRRGGSQKHARLVAV